MPVLPTRPRRRAWLALAIALGVALLVSPFTGRAEVDGGYRPLLGPDALKARCYPLPGDVELPFPYVLRHDGQVLGAGGLRRQLVLHYDVVDGAEARRRAEEAFAEAGVAADVHLTVRDFDVPDDAIVRGEMVLELPVEQLASDAAACRDPYVTKRFPADAEDVS